jgi:Domain of unknown function (DUF1918)
MEMDTGRSRVARRGVSPSGARLARERGLGGGGCKQPSGTGSACVAISWASQRERTGEIIEVRGAGGEPPYLVRFDDGHTSLVFPGPDAVIEHPRKKGRKRPGKAE